MSIHPYRESQHKYVVIPLNTHRKIPNSACLLKHICIYLSLLLSYQNVLKFFSPSHHTNNTNIITSAICHALSITADCWSSSCPFFIYLFLCTNNIHSPQKKRNSVSSYVQEDDGQKEIIVVRRYFFPKKNLKNEGRKDKYFMNSMRILCHYYYHY